MKHKIIVKEFEEITNLPSQIKKELEEFAKRNSKILSFSSKGNLKAQNYVGIIETKSGFTLEILPKIYDGNEEETKQIYLKMLSILFNLPKITKSDISNLEKYDSVFEIFIYYFLVEVEMIIKKGLKSDYILKEDNLNKIKGKILFNKHISKNIIHKEKHYCEFDEYSLNRPINKIIKTTLKYLLNISKSPKNKKLIRINLEKMSEIDFSTNIDRDLKSVKFHRGMEHYKIAFSIAKIFLKKSGFSAFSGKSISFAFFIPMQLLFESAVEYLLKKRYKNYKVYSQYKKQNFVKNKFSIKADFVIKKDNEIIKIIDAKWKTPFEDNSSLSQADFYQMFAYKEFLNVNRVYLYYPMTENFQKCKKFKYFDGSRIIIYSVDLKKEFLNK